MFICWLAPPPPSQLNDRHATVSFYLNFVILSDGHCSHVVLLSQLLWERGGHKPPPDVRGCGEVSLAGLPSRRWYHRIKLHFGWLFWTNQNNLIMTFNTPQNWKNGRACLEQWKFQNALFFSLFWNKHKYSNITLE